MIFNNSNPALNKIRYYFSFSMVAVYLGLGLLFFFTDIGIENFPMYRSELGITMMVYACVRLFMTIKKIKRIKNNEL